MLRKYRVNRELVRQDLATNFGELPFPHKTLKLVGPPEPEPPPVEAVEAVEAVPETVLHWKVNAGQTAVLKHFQRIFPTAITDLELSKHFHDTGSTSRSRRKELVDAGLIVYADIRKKIGRTNHKLWIASDKGRAVDLP
jgi:hypothetical protein